LWVREGGLSVHSFISVDVKEVAMRHRIAALVVLALAVPGIARAAAINIDDTKTNDTITITVNDFEGGFTVNGALIQQGLGNPGSATVSEQGPLNFQGRWLVPGGVAAHERIIYLVDSLVSPTAPAVVSDILRYATDNEPSSGLAIITGSFLSDFENNLGTVPAGTSPNDIFLENGEAVIFSEPFLSGVVLSDVEIPEPATLTVLAIGLLGAACRRRPRQRA
jgi:hypothetical protein